MAHAAGSAGDSVPASPRVLLTRVVPLALAHSAAHQLLPGSDPLAECNDSLAEHGNTCSKMGRVYEKMGRLDEAMDMLLQYLVIAQRSVGPARLAALLSPCPRRPRAPAHAAHARALRGCAGWETRRARARRAVPLGLCTKRWETTRPPSSR